MKHQQSFERLQEHPFAALCQAFLPYNDPGDKREWTQKVDEFTVFHASAGLAPGASRDFVKLGLPFGPVVRTLFLHINRMALEQHHPVIESRELLANFGQNYDDAVQAAKEQLARICATSIEIWTTRHGAWLCNITTHKHFLHSFSSVCPVTFRLSGEYWENLRKHAAPFEEIPHPFGEGFMDEFLAAIEI